MPFDPGNNENNQGLVITMEENFLRTLEELKQMSMTQAHDKQKLQQANRKLTFMKEKLACQNQDLTQALDVIKKDLEVACKIQRSLLPTACFRTENVEAAWYFQPCDSVGGDLLNIFKLDDSHIAFYLLDVTGHGVQAALLSVTLSRMLTNWKYGDNLLLRPSGEIRSPQDVIGLLNKRFQMDMETLQSFTIIYGVLNTDRFELQYVRAGHPALLVCFPGGEVQIWEDGNLPVGWSLNTVFSRCEKRLPAGTRLFLYSDGLLETSNTRLENKVSYRNLADLIRQHSHIPLQACVDGLVKAINKNLDDGGAKDDNTLLAIEIKRVESKVG